MQFLILIAELLVLFFLSSSLTHSLFLLFFLFFKAKTVAITLITLLLFPGTVVHELSHLFTAEIMGVHTGKIELVPEIIDKENLKTGSVAIAHTGPFRRVLIGLAPIFAGLVSLTVIAYFLSTTWPQVQQDFQNGVMFSQFSVYLLALLLYLLFAVSNSMFSSPADVSGLLPLLLTLTIIFGGAWIAGFRLSLTGTALSVTNQIITTLVQSLGVVLGLNIVLLLVTKLFVRMIAKSRGVKILK